MRVKSRSVQSSDSIQNRCVRGISSHTINKHLQRKSAQFSPVEMLQTHPFTRILCEGNRKMKWDVHQCRNAEVATPVLATLTQM